MTLAEQTRLTKNEMVRISAAMDAAWDLAGVAHARTRITLCRQILESPDAEWNVEREGVIKALNALAPAPPAPPPAPVSYWDERHGAVVVVAGNASPDLLRAAGVQEIFFEITLPATIAEMKTGRWGGFVCSGFFTTRTRVDSVGAAKVEAQVVAAAYGMHSLRALWIDTEIWKADIVPAGPKLTDAFYGELRALLGPAVPIGNITYGWHQDTNVVPRDVLVKHNIEPWWEAYNGDAASWDLRAVVEKLNTQGHKPARISLGHKMLPAHVPLFKQLVAEGKAAKKTILWDVSLGPAVEALAQGVKLT